jgi:hypothetical protein
MQLVALDVVLCGAFLAMQLVALDVVLCGTLLAMQLVPLDLLFGEAFLAVNLAGLIHVLLVGHSTIPFRSQLLGLISRLSIVFARGLDLCRADD